MCIIRASEVGNKDRPIGESEGRERTYKKSIFPEAPQARKDSKHEKKMYKNKTYR